MQSPLGTPTHTSHELSVSPPLDQGDSVFLVRDLCAARTRNARIDPQSFPELIQASQALPGLTGIIEKATTCSKKTPKMPSSMHVSRSRLACRALRAAAGADDEKDSEDEDELSEVSS